MANILGSFCGGDSLEVTRLNGQKIVFTKAEINTRISLLPAGPLSAKLAIVREKIIEEIIEFVGEDNMLPEELALDLNSSISLRII